MSDDSLKKFDRIVAIFIQLQSKRTVKAQELADRFQVSLRTIYRDIRTLEGAGVPILAEPGSGYSIMDGYRLPPVMFTREEAAGFVAAEKLMQEMADKTLKEHFRSAMYKVKSVLRSREKDWVSTVESSILVRTGQPLFQDNVSDALGIIMEGIAEKKQVALHYQAFAADTPEHRKIEPVGLFHENHYWYILGFCHLRHDYRQFRTDRIWSIKRTDLPFLHQHEHVDRHFKKQQTCEKVEVRIRVAKDVIKYIKNARRYYGFTDEIITGSEVEITFLTADPYDSFARWYLTFADRATIIEPLQLKEKVAALAASAIANLSLNAEVEKAYSHT